MSEEQQSQPQPQLTDKQKMFIDQYFICGFNATEAARQAGYQGNEDTLRSIASENLTKPYIRSEIDRRMADFHLSANEILARLADHATASMDDFLTPSGLGMRIDLLKAKRLGKLHLLKSFSKVKGSTKIEIYDAHAALVDMAKNKGLLIERHEHTGKDGGPIETKEVSLTDEERAERIAALLEKVKKRQDGQPTSS